MKTADSKTKVATGRLWQLCGENSQGRAHTDFPCLSHLSFCLWGEDEEMEGVFECTWQGVCGHLRVCFLLLLWESEIKPRLSA